MNRVQVHPVDVNKMVWETTQAIRMSALNFDAPRFFAKAARVMAAQKAMAEKALFAPPENENYNQDIDLDDDLYYIKKKLGRLPIKGKEWIIHTTIDPNDVYLVRSWSEKKKWDSNTTQPATMIFNVYKAEIELDGVHARVVVDPDSLMVKKCPNCANSVIISDIDVALSNKAVFCSMKCKKEYKAKCHTYQDRLRGEIQLKSQETQRRLDELHKMIYGNDYKGSKFYGN